jgi:uncharacterized lipoprotein YddW (UPF0748 family)
MKKREFLKVLGRGSIGIAAPSLFFGCDQSNREVAKLPGSKPLPAHWLWMRPPLGLSDDEWKRRLAQIREVGIEAILPEVYNGNTALFEHPQVSMRENFLEQILPLAKEAGLEVHAWMWSMICNNKEILEKHPDWFAVNGKGEPANTHPAYVGYYRFMCPCHPEVQEFVEGNVRVLANISELDGVHLDYIRLPDVILAEGLQPKYNIVQDKEYPEYDYSYSTYCRDQFREQAGIDPLEIEEPAANEAWRQFRYDSITRLVNEKLVPEARKKGKTITAAVFPNWESVRQQWHRWELDAFLPMLYHKFYNAQIPWIGRQVQAARERLQDKKPVYSGLYFPFLKPEELPEAIQSAKEGGAKGIALFDYNSIKEEHWEVLNKKRVLWKLF